MFDKLLDHVTFKDFETFCQQFPEGVRVEYKREPANIDKTVASLANTVGGFFVLEAKDRDLAFACVLAYNDWTIDEWLPALGRS